MKADKIWRKYGGEGGERANMGEKGKEREE